MDLLRVATRTAGVLLLLTALCGWARPARAQLLSPGKLTQAHSQLDGLRNCTQCHSRGDRLDDNLCRKCHTEIASRENAKTGFHGRVAIQKKDCAACHTDHKGRAYDIIDWGGPREKFNHSQVGYDLTGAHGTTDCRKCHDTRLVTAGDIRGLLKEGKAKKTYLGLSESCKVCHFDEHRGQLSKKCGKCHNTVAFAPAPSFRHNRDTKYALTGKHVKVKCGQCHPRLTDKTVAANAFPAPKKNAYSKYSNVKFASCENCHKDPHAGSLGKTCTKCHSTSGWMDLSESADINFHDKTRYPLRGAHRTVSCKDCHGPFPGRDAKFKNLAFSTCETSGCHVDAHLGQFTYNPKKKSTCEPCHSVKGFKPTSYGIRDHDKTRYPLKGSHQAVACDECHAKTKSLEKKIPRKVKSRLVRQGRKLLFTTAQFDFDKRVARCETCHADVHAAQFDRRTVKAGCKFCHNEKSFTDIRFDHNRYSRFKLENAHAKTDCIECHRDGRLPNGKTGTIYRGVERACASCHADVHIRQFDNKKGKSKPCDFCHTTQDFKQLLFVHNSDVFSDFPLKGQHKDVECEKCHHSLPLSKNLAITQYVGLPRECEQCHEDFHKDDALLKEMVSRVKQPGSRQKEESLGACAGCHNEATWLDIRFEAHDETGFPLRGAHNSATCAECHDQGFDQKQSHACTSCHEDIHQGEFGDQCMGCHTEENWDSTFDVLAHRQTNFPLTGQHAMIPCQECHPSTQVGFATAATTCVSCHAADYDRTALTTIDHKSSGFSTQCETCHDPWSFRPGRFPDHDVCFAITRGPHAGIQCQQCHTIIPTGVVTGACDTGTATCTSCHEHEEARTASQHDGVPGYDYQDAKCYSCHPFS